MFSDYFQLGLDHILDPNGYDHILFVTVLCALYNPVEWKKIIILVTAFTVGHSLTLALSVLNMISFNPSLIEKLIPVTIILNGIFNIITILNQRFKDSNVSINYFLALGFGFIHGMGFSGYFKAILGSEESILKPLFAFNLGVEAGQIVIVAVVMCIGYLLLDVFRIKKTYWTIPVSAVSIIIAMYLLSGR